jgi:hypothetical protein
VNAVAELDMFAILTVETTVAGTVRRASAHLTFSSSELRTHSLVYVALLDRIIADTQEPLFYGGAVLLFQVQRENFPR